MIKKFNIFEKIEWYENGEFIEDEGSNDLECKEIEEFKIFLRDNNALDHYINNVNNRLTSIFKPSILLTENNFEEVFVREPYKGRVAEDWVTMGFGWSNTPQKHEYWEILHNKWQKQCEVLKISKFEL